MPRRAGVLRAALLVACVVLAPSARTGEDARATTTTTTTTTGSSRGVGVGVGVGVAPRPPAASSSSSSGINSLLGSVFGGGVRVASAAHTASEGVAGLADHRTSADATPSIETQFGNQHGLVAIGMVAELLNELNGAFCDQTLTREYKCDAYEDARQRLWFTFANDYICGVDETQWSSGVVMRNLAVQEQFEYLLSQARSDLIRAGPRVTASAR